MKDPLAVGVLVLILLCIASAAVALWVRERARRGDHGGVDSHLTGGNSHLGSLS